MTSYTFDLGLVRSGLSIRGYYDTLAELEAAITTPSVGDIYGVGMEAPYELYAWGGTGWVDNGTIKGPQGDTGPAGADGQDGAPGQAATISVGSVTTGAAGSNASVTNSGTSSAAVFDFVIPRGAQGPAGADGQDGQDGAPGQNGADGAAATIAVGTVTTGAAGSSASVTNSGTSSAAVFDFVIPRGPQGEPGASAASGVSITDGGSYYTGSTVEAALQEIGSTLDGVETLLAAI